MKNGAVSLSFGYVATEQEKRADGINELRTIDLFEISVVAHPANQDTHFIDLKSAAGPTVSDEDFGLAALFDDPVFASAPKALDREKVWERIESISEEWTEDKARTEREEKAAARAERKAKPLTIATFSIE